MSWSLSTDAVKQSEVRTALEERRDEAAESYGGYSDAVRDQQDAAFAAAETLVDKAEFGGAKVRVSASGHVQNAEKTDALNHVAVSISEVPG